MWKVVVPNSLFGGFNPFAEEVEGDWIVYAEQTTPRKHLGDVYLNGRSFYEVVTLAEVSDPPLRTEVLDDWTGTSDRIRDPEQTRYVWYAEVGAEETTIWANFQGADPNEELVEINVRRSVFYPTEHHLDYITVRGFELAQAACPWTPPTADQPGLIGPNWAKGWIIEDNVIHDAKCSAVSLGKEASTGHNYATLRSDKPGYQYQLESVFSARQIGWDREHVGSHIVRRNHIYDCGQNGIVGHLGCVFSTIEDNHIHHIALKREFYGYEIGGIKLHAALDVVIRHNRIHDCSLGIWLDWQTQGTRVSRNLLYANNRDLFIEVSHGPHLVEHNVLASPASLELFSQGGAFVNNLAVRDRAAPTRRGATDAVPRAAQHAGRRLRRDPRRRRPLHRQRLPGRRPRLGLWADLTLRSAGRQRHRRLRRAPRVAGRLPRPGRRPVPRRPRALHERQAGGLDPRQRLRRGRRRVRGRARSHRPRRRDGRRRRGGRGGLPRDAAARGLRRGAHRAHHRRATSSASASWTRSSRSPTAARRASTPTSSAPPRPAGRRYAAGPLATLAAGSSRTRVW